VGPHYTNHTYHSQIHFETRSLHSAAQVSETHLDDAYLPASIPNAKQSGQLRFIC